MPGVEQGIVNKEEASVYKNGRQSTEKKVRHASKKRGRPRPLLDRSISPEMLSNLPTQVDTTTFFEETLDLVRKLERKKDSDSRAKAQRLEARKARQRESGEKKR